MAKSVKEQDDLKGQSANVKPTQSAKQKDGGPEGSANTQGAQVPLPPDGGWGWVIVLSSFMVGVLVDGICFTFGFFFREFQDYFNANKSITSTISSVLNGTYLTIGPIAGALVNKFGCRRVAMVGVVISSASFFLSTYSPNVETMIVVYGLCGGIGFGLAYLPAIVMVGYYFDTKRALATGIAVCGSGIGSFVFSPLCEYLLKTYDWRGAMWIISGLVLNGLVFVSLFRPLVYVEETSSQEDLTTFDEGKKQIAMNPTVQGLKSGSIHRWRSLEDCHKHNNNSKETEIARLGHSLFLDNEPRSRKHRLGKIVLNPLERKDIFYSGSIQNLDEFKKAGNEERFVQSMLSLNESDKKDSKDGLRNWCNKVFSDMFDFSLLKSVTFVIYGLSCFLCMVGFFVPFIYIPDIAEQQGITSSQTAWVISTIGIINTVGRLAVGYISDKSWADSILINTGSLVVGGVVTMFVPYIPTFELMVAYALVFGFSIAAFVSLRSIIIVELLGIEKLTNSFGIVVLCQGLSTFIGSPIAGALFDLTGDYRASFYLAGTVMTVSGLMCIPLRRISRWEQHRMGKKNDQSKNNAHEREKMLP